MADKGKPEVLGVRCTEKAPLAQTCGEGLCCELGHTVTRRSHVMPIGVNEWIGKTNGICALVAALQLMDGLH